MKKINYIKTYNLDFAHYTNAEAALSIIDKQELWMTEIDTMNDYTEFSHGVDCFKKALEGNTGKAITEIFDNLTEGHFSSHIINNIIDFRQNPDNKIYSISCSEHHSLNDRLGKLSMWRGYSGNDEKVAFILKGDVLLDKENSLNIWSTPVAYLDALEFKQRLLDICLNIEENKKFILGLKEKNSRNLAQKIYLVLLFAMLSVKHKGFYEEQEWRVVYLPSQFTSDPDKVISGNRTRKDVEEPIFKIQLKGKLDLNKILEKIIIGPSRNPELLEADLIKTLNQKGVKNAADKIIISDIPLRT
jgi:hypothetical protein